MVLALLVAGGVALSTRGSQESSLNLATSGTTAQGATRVVVLMDGWSWASVRGDHPSWYGQASGTGASAPLDLSPVSATQVAWLAAHAPDALARVAGRMLTTSSDVRCSTSGCTSANGSVPLRWFSDLASVPGWGPMYAAWGIRSALYVTELAVPAGEGSLELGATGWASDVIPLSYGAPLGAGSTPPATVDDGWNRDLFLTGAGLGRFFTPTPAWSAPAAAPAAPWYSPVLSAADGALTGPVHQPSPLFDGGLGAPSAASGQLNASELTFLTSPTSGCGLALCVPGRAAVRVRGYASRDLTVCSTQVAGLRETAELETSTWSFTPAHPTSQLSLYDGASPRSFAGASGGGSVLAPGTPAFATGPQRMRVNALYLYTGQSATGGTTLAPVFFGGTVFDAARTPAATADARPTLPQDLAGWRLC